MSLSELVPGETGIVTEISSHSRIRRRLQDLGLVPGTRVECVNEGPLGALKAYEIRRTVIAIRQEDARQIFVQEAAHA